jgi:hypothetical protein
MRKIVKDSPGLIFLVKGVRARKEKRKIYKCFNRGSVGERPYFTRRRNVFLEIGRTFLGSCISLRLPARPCLPAGRGRQGKSRPSVKHRLVIGNFTPKVHGQSHQIHTTHASWMFFMSQSPPANSTQSYLSLPAAPK